MTFAQLGIQPWLCKALQELKMTRPTPIQTQCIPPILAGKSCLGIAETGSGKTAAFALPIIQDLSRDPFGIFAVVLTPTRELAYMIADQFNIFGRPIQMRLSVVTGGVDMMEQSSELGRKPHVIVATPGRLLSHLQHNPEFSLKKIRYLVLDEADRLLDDAALGLEVSKILDLLPPADVRRTLLFSATVTPELDALAEVGGFVKAYANMSHKLVDTLEEYYLFVPQSVKEVYLYAALKKLMDSAEHTTAIIFCATCRGCQLVYYMLRHMEIEAAPLHSVLKQTQRLASLGKFRSGKVRILISTDVASRGLDIPDVSGVFNFDVPPATADYVHRVGRTARAGRRGFAVSLVTQYDVDRVRAIEERTGKQMVLFSEHRQYGIADKDIEKDLTKVVEAKKMARIKMMDAGWDDKLDRFSDRKRKTREETAQALVPVSSPSDTTQPAGASAAAANGGSRKRRRML